MYPRIGVAACRSGVPLPAVQQPRKHKGPPMAGLCEGGGGGSSALSAAERRHLSAACRPDVATAPVTERARDEQAERREQQRVAGGDDHHDVGLDVDEIEVAARELDVRERDRGARQERDRARRQTQASAANGASQMTYCGEKTLPSVTNASSAAKPQRTMWRESGAARGERDDRRQREREQDARRAPRRRSA